MRFAPALMDPDACLPRLAELLGQSELATEPFRLKPPADGSAPPTDWEAYQLWLGEEPVCIRIFRPARLPEIALGEQ